MIKSVGREVVTGVSWNVMSMVGPFNGWWADQPPQRRGYQVPPWPRRDKLGPNGWKLSSFACFYWICSFEKCSNSFFRALLHSLVLSKKVDGSPQQREEQEWEIPPFAAKGFCWNLLEVSCFLGANNWGIYSPISPIVPLGCVGTRSKATSLEPQMGAEHLDQAMVAEQQKDVPLLQVQQPQKDWKTQMRWRRIPLKCLKNWREASSGDDEALWGIFHDQRMTTYLAWRELQRVKTHSVAVSDHGGACSYVQLGALQSQPHEQ
ncbi:hypothetical protein Taro_056188 [Colocasia esculenta]|uniref:Uncharacterized protein n=1 Tax=Colocasia esculenta TaxID=4460 RepID=A0A843XWI5_COLES|nr:hypothetical protein [Colocasia esculenta]